MRLSVAVAVTFLVFTSLSVADPAAAAIKKQTNIPAQALGNALQTFATDRELQILYRSEVVGDRHTRAVVGEFTISEALTELLDGTGLTYKYLDDKTITIVPTASASATAGRESKNSTTRATPDATKGGEQKSWSRFRLAQVDEGKTAESDRAVVESDLRRGIPEILVKAKRSLNTDIERTADDIQPYVVFDRTSIDRSGARSIEDFLSTQLTSATQPVSSAQTNSGSNRSTFSLRGLASEQALILVDGRRVASSGSQTLQPDLNGIPLSAIERIEVLPTTASAIYGGGATGGVVNVVLRRDYSGIEGTVNYENSFEGGGAIRRVDLASGFHAAEGRTNVMLIGSFSDGVDLRRRDRDYQQRGLSRILANDPASLVPGFSPPGGATTNICAATEVFPGSAVCGGDQLVLDNGTPLGSSFSSVPKGYTGVASDGGAALVANAGVYNFDLANSAQYAANGGNTSLLATPTVKALKGSIGHAFTPSIDAFVDLSWSRNEGRFTTSEVGTTYLLAADAPANPFAQPVLVSTPGLGTNQSAFSTITDKRAVAGFIFKLPAQWQLAIDYTWNRTDVDSTGTSVALDPLVNDAVANGVDSQGASFDVFRDTGAAGLTFAPYLTEPTLYSPLRTTFKDATIRAGGPLPFDLPAGSPAVTAIAEHRTESYNDRVTTFPAFDFSSIAYASSQEIDSLYAEALVPLISSRNPRSWAQRLELQVAARYEEYQLVAGNSTFSIPGVIEPEERTRTRRSFSSTDPFVGLRYQPIEDVTFRVSYGTGFLPPAMTDLVPGADIPTSGLVSGLVDPRRGGEPLGDYTSDSGGNPLLLPEESESRSLGVILTPRALPALRVSLDWLRIRKKNNVERLAADQSLINNEALYPGLITRAPASGGFDVGPITAIGSSAINVGRARVEAYDLKLDYHVEAAGAGQFGISAAVTRNKQLAAQVTPDAPYADIIHTIGGLKWRGTTTLSWDHLGWNAQWMARYVDSYCLNTGCVEGLNTQAQGSLTVPSRLYHDVSAGYRFDSGGLWDLLSQSEVRIGVRNVFDAKAPVDLSSLSYYSTLGDPHDRTYRLMLRKAF